MECETHVHFAFAASGSTATLCNLANTGGYRRFRYLGYVCMCWREISQATNTITQQPQVLASMAPVV